MKNSRNYCNNHDYDWTYHWDAKESTTANCKVWGPHLGLKALAKSPLIMLFIPLVIVNWLSMLRVGIYKKYINK